MQRGHGWPQGRCKRDHWTTPTQQRINRESPLERV